MYKVLIIDDEQPVREAIRLLGRWEELGVGEIKEASNGREGMDILQTFRPDLVMVDMKMPEVDGVAFLQLVERDHQDLLVIVISGYNDFEYTQQAIRSRVIDYLLKPVNRHGLHESLRKAVGVLEARRRTESEFISRNITLNMSLPKLKEQIYQSLMARDFNKQMNGGLLPLIGADQPDNRFAAGVLRILNLEEIQVKRFKGDARLLHFAVANTISELADRDGGGGASCFCFANPGREREMLVFFTVKGRGSEEWEPYAVRLLKRAADSLRSMFGIELAAGAGRFEQDPARLADSYEGAKASLYAADLLRPMCGRVIGAGSPSAPAAASAVQAGTIATAPSLPRKTVIFSSYMPQLRTALEAGNSAQAERVAGEFLMKISQGEAFSLVDADRTLRECMVLLNDLALEMGVSEERLPAGNISSLYKQGIHADFASFGQYGELFRRLVAYYGEQIRKALESGRQFDISDIREYIDRNYFEEIKISRFTEKYYLSREYLMKLFKQKYNIGIHAYTQKVRMDKAAELLADPALKIQEISDLLGYKDKNYFSKAFRNYYEVSPSEFRAALEEAKK